MSETQREVHMGRPFESRLHIVFDTKNHLYQLRSAGDLVFCFMTLLSRRIPLGPRHSLTHSLTQVQCHAAQRTDTTVHLDNARVCPQRRASCLLKEQARM